MQVLIVLIEESNINKFKFVVQHIITFNNISYLIVANMWNHNNDPKIVIIQTDKHHHKHHHHHHKHHQPEVIVVETKTSNQGFNGGNQGWGGSSQGMNQGFNNGGNQGWGGGSNQGWNNQGMNQGGNQGWGGSNQGGNQGWGGSNQGNQGWNNQGFNNGGNQGWGGSNQGTNQGFNNGGNQGWGGGSNQGWNGNPNFKPLFDPNRDYIIVSDLDDDLALDVSLSPQNIGQLIIWKKHGKKNQRFRFVHHNGKYNIISMANMNLVSVNNNAPTDGQFLYTSGNAAQHGQLWDFTIVKEGKNKFYIRNGFEKYLDVFEARKKKGTPVIQWAYNGNRNQQWHIIPA